MHVKRNDIVIALTGRSAVGGKTGKVLQVLPKRGVAIVEGFNIVKKALRKTQDTPQGGIGEKEASIAISNLQIFCPTCKRGVRIKRVRGTGRKTRQCRKCGHEFDA